MTKTGYDLTKLFSVVAGLLLEGADYYLLISLCTATAANRHQYELPLIELYCPRNYCILTCNMPSNVSW
jgi:hypothetical protein